MYPQAFRQLTRLLPERLVQEPGSLIAYQKRTKHNLASEKKATSTREAPSDEITKKKLKRGSSTFLKNGMTTSWKATRIKCSIF